MTYEEKVADARQRIEAYLEGTVDRSGNFRDAKAAFLAILDEERKAERTSWEKRIAALVDVVKKLRDRHHYELCQLSVNGTCGCEDYTLSKIAVELRTSSKGDQE